MFHRRRAASNPASRNPPSSAALLAAGKAFPQTRDARPGLSSAAAAAALRTHATSPTPVGDTVTKRMVRRGSTSSQGSGGVPPGQLRRHSSSGSMTERSFRAPSPNRGSPATQFDHHDAPPVPAVPKNVPGVGVVHRRASSLEPPFRVSSPVGRGGGRGVSLDRGGYAPASGRGQSQGIRVNTLAQVPETDQQADSSPSVNFSRPMSPATASSPTPQSKKKSGTGWFAAPVYNSEQTFRGGATQRPKTSDGSMTYDLNQAQQSVQNAADRPVAKHRTMRGVEGARLSTGSMHAKPGGSSLSNARPQTAHASVHTSAAPVDPKSPHAVYDPSTRRFVHKQEAMERFRALDHQEETSTHQYVQQHAQPPRAQARSPRPVEYTPMHVRSPSPPPKSSQRPTSFVHFERPVTPPAEPEYGEEDHYPQPEERPAIPPISQDRAGAKLARQSSENYAGEDVRTGPIPELSHLADPVVPEATQEAAMNPTSPKMATNQEGAYPRLAPAAPAAQTPAHATLNTQHGSIRGERNHSMSPPRNAHFAAASLELPNGVKHQPPPRSVSPAKSALKASPSVSRRNSSPLASEVRHAARGAPSETSDNMSDDGVRKRKKQVRVSFEEEPVIAGSSAYSEEPVPSIPTGLGASRWNTDQKEDLDDIMKPRPMLPSFGSVRDKNRRADEGDAPEKVTETVSSSLSTSVGSIGEPLDASSDHAVGGILAQDFAKKSALKPSPMEPLPPEVTTVEGSGYASDSEQSDVPFEPTPPSETRLSDPKAEPVSEVPQIEPKTLTIPESKPPPPEVPIIAVQPASPSPTPKAEPKYRPFVPGGWDDDEESEPEIQEPVPPPAEVKPIQFTSLDLPTKGEESSDDNSSIYSDAYEEITDDEGGGFASIDALMESPTAPVATSGLMFSKYADTTPAEAPKSDLSKEATPVETKQTSAPGEGWNAAQQHWKGLSDSRKQEPQEPAPVAHAVTTDKALPPKTQAAKPQQAKATPVRATPTKASAAPAGRKVEAEPVRTSPKAMKTPQEPTQRLATQPRKSAMKKTPVAIQPPSSGPQMRKTMRGGPPSPTMRTQGPGETHMRRSMRTTEPMSTARGPSAGGLAASRHSMPPTSAGPPKGALQKKHIPATATASPPRPKSATTPVAAKPIKAVVPAPTHDDDSDGSASSFRRERQRRPRSESGGRYTMRASMRSGPAPTMRASAAPRPMSPPLPASSPPPTSFRKSMRPSSPTPDPIAEGGKPSRFSIRSLSPAGRFRSPKTTPFDAPPMPTQTSSPKRNSGMFNKAPKAKAPAEKAAKPRFKSRFGDSSDEEDDERPSRFQSRFADSDDEDDFDLPAGLTPVRGIPRKPGEEDGDSTDLEDEASDEEGPSAKTLPKKAEVQATNGNVNGQGAPLASGSLRQSKHAPGLPSFEPEGKKTKKRGFFGMGKKKEPLPELTAPETRPEPQRVDSDIPYPPEHRNRPLSAIDEDKAVEASSPGRMSSRLQRRANTPEWGRSTSDSWPLPQPRTVGEEARPQSSDGIIPRRSSLRPTLTKRNSAMSEARTAIDPKSGKEVVIGRTGKKKKFQGLRRVFGLND